MILASIVNWLSQYESLNLKLLFIFYGIQMDTDDISTICNNK